MSVFETSFSKYRQITAVPIQLIDAFIAFQLYLLLASVAYLLVGGSFPLNSFYSAMFVTLGSAVFAVNLRIQLVAAKPLNQCFSDFLLCNLVLHLAAFNFLG